MKRFTILIPFIVAVLVVVGLILRQSTVPKVSPKVKQPLYIAMGDSVAAGVGLNTYSDTTACYRTNESYPNLIAKTLDYKLYNLACSGASISTGVLGSQEVNKLSVAPQLLQLYALPTPHLITMTIGANDVQWSSLIVKCYTEVCGSTDDTASFTKSLTVMSSDLKNILESIKNHYKDTVPKLVITSYQEVFPTVLSSICNDLSGINTSELNWWRMQESALNNTLRDTASAYPFVLYVPVDFRGHELCTTDPWVQSLAQKAPYHPTESGQNEFAKSIIDAIKAAH